MSSSNIELFSSGIQELMKSDEVIEELQKHADEIVSKCSGNYETSTVGLSTKVA